MKPTSPLPIDNLIPELLNSLEQKNAAVITAEPGAGKTTRVPPALLGAAFTKDKEIWVLQPRRLAAKIAAVILDEFHERSLALELGVAWLRRLQMEKRPDLRLLVMSATLDASALSE